MAKKAKSKKNKIEKKSPTKKSTAKSAKKGKKVESKSKKTAASKSKKVEARKSKPAKTSAATPSAKKIAAKKVAVSSAPKETKESRAKRRALRAKAEKAAAKAEPTLQEAIAAMPITPSPKILKHFRQIAKNNKKDQEKRAKARKRNDGFIAKPPKTGKSFKVDLRVHSPGTVGFFTMGGVETASALVRLAKVKGLDIVGITDYYNGVAIDEVKDVAIKSGLTVIPGVDLCCRVGLCEEVHLSALFPETFTSGDIFSLLEALRVPTQMYGRQDYCLETELSQVLAEVESRGGIVIPTRLDKTPHRQLAIRPLVENYGFHAFDVVYPENLDCFRDWPDGQFTFVGFSNAYSLGQVGSRTAKMKLNEPTFEAIKELFKRREVQGTEVSEAA